MSQIDLKQATITIVDNYTGNGGVGGFLVNHSGGYTNGDTTMTVDTGAGTFAIGDSFKVAGDTTAHTITAASGTPTTSVTFTPALAGTVADNAAITVLNHALEIKVGKGTCTYDEKRNMDYQLNRGLLDTVREGDEIPMDVSFDFIWDFLKAQSSDTIPTIEEALKRTGKAAAWASSSTDACEPYAVDIEILYTPTCSSAQNERILLEDFRWEDLKHDLVAGQISVSGKCNHTRATITRNYTG